MGDPAILDQLEAVREGSRGWMARCPAHEDRSPSLSVSLGDDGRTLLRCFAGCSAAEVLAALSLEWAALFPDGMTAPSTPAPQARVRPVLRKPKPKPQPVHAIIDALNVAGQDWRATPDPDMWVIAVCPFCDAAAVWLWAPLDETPRFSCPDGCSRDQILEALEALADLSELGARA